MTPLGHLPQETRQNPHEHKERPRFASLSIARSLPAPSIDTMFDWWRQWPSQMALTTAIFY
jgi:hypothetical protein